MNQDKIRNFCIIAHIDHGKSTLADRLLEVTGTVSKREMKEQLLDQLKVERDKGITVKLQPVRMNYKDHQLNLIDTPGHVDFSYEVSRSLEACESAILVVDATQGIQAQTLANVYLALEADLKIIPVINKIDLPAADVPKVTREIHSLLGDKEEILSVSAKTGEGVEAVLDKIISDTPVPRGDKDADTRALIFDSYFDEYRGVVLAVRLVDGNLPSLNPIKIIGTKSEGIAQEVGFNTPKNNKVDTLYAGEIGYIVTDLKKVSDAQVGDTVTLQKNQNVTPLPGYKPIKPFVYAGVFPVSTDEHTKLKEALEKLALNDAALEYEQENSPVLGFGFRVGFLGLLHLDIVIERLKEDYDMDIIVTQPSTEYEIVMTSGEVEKIKSAAHLPDVMKIQEIKEPWIKGEVVTPKEHVGPVVQQIVQLRGHQTLIDYIDDNLAVINFEAPLANIITDFYDNLKSITSGYGSFNYELDKYRAEDLVRVDLLVASESVDSLSTIVHKTEAERVGRNTVKKLKDVIPKQMFKVSLQAAIGGKIIAREDIQALKKNVTGHLYGGDVSRKKKLWAKQKAGKARMKKFGKVEIPAEAFKALITKD